MEKSNEQAELQHMQQTDPLHPDPYTERERIHSKRNCHNGNRYELAPALINSAYAHEIYPQSP